MQPGPGAAGAIAARSSSRVETLSIESLHWNEQWQWAIWSIKEKISEKKDENIEKVTFKGMNVSECMNLSDSDSHCHWQNQWVWQWQILLS